MLALARKHVPFLLAALFVAPAFACAALVNINTADTDQLDTLPGIGPSKAAAIVEYRAGHGPFARIEDLQNVSGIGAVTFAHIKAFITVSDGGTGTPADTSASSTNAAAVSARAPGGSSAYVPPPAALSVTAGPDRGAFLDVPLTLAAKVKTGSGAPDPSAVVTWSFGDGSQTSGSSVEKTYRHPGTYLVVVTATDGAAVAQGELTVTAEAAQVRIATESADGIVIANDAAVRLDLSRWRLTAGGGAFRLPPGTMLLPYAQVLFPYEITNLPVAFDAVLAYPDGSVAAHYAPPLASTTLAEGARQPSRSSAGSQSQQTVDPAPAIRRVMSTSGNKQYEAATVSAPAAATNVAAAGAAFAASSSASAGAQPAAARTRSGLFTSPWTFGFLGLVTLAGGALMIL